jgi:hypothetical protein
MQVSWWRHVPPLVPIGIPTGFWGPNPRNHPPMALRSKPPNPLEKYIRYASSMILTRVTVVLDHLITKSSSASAWLGQPLSWLGQHGLLLLCILALVDIAKCQPPTVSLPVSFVPRSKPHVRPSPLLVHWHNTSLLDLLHRCRPSQCTTPAHHKSRDMLHHTLKAMVSPKLNQSLIISRQSLIINSTHKGTYQPGRPYTWNNMQTPPLLLKLDWAFRSAD